MKTYFIGLFVAIAVLFNSCGSSSNEKNENKQETTEESSYKSSTGNLIVELPKEWKKGQYGIEGPDGHSLYAYNFESSGDIYNDINDDYSEKLDEVKKVTIDGLPALTVQRKFMQNEAVISRTWLIYNGKDVILFAVQAPEEKFNDEIAQSVVPYIKITEREENVELPKKAKEAKYKKPASFPEEFANKFTDLYAEEAILTEAKIQDANNALETLHAYGFANVEEENAEEQVKQIMDSIFTANNLDGWKDIEKTVSVSFTSVGILLPLMAHLDSVDENSIDYTTSIDMVKSSISNYNISLEDLNFCYDNWEQIVSFIEEQEARNEE